ncbi:hypothetical protein Bca101_055487 [Brassica carinata]
MTTAGKRPGKEHVPDGDCGDDLPDKMLPPRLFATDRFPSRRLNNYSSLEYLLIVRDALRGSPDYDRLMDSCFGKLFLLPARRCSYSSVDDPEGDFCNKLRQKTKKMGGFPLGLQLAAYEMIPQLLARLSGNDDEKLLDCVKAPQHRGLTLVDVLEAEHDPKLLVQPQMEIDSDMPPGWGTWDEEIFDRRVNYLCRLVADGHRFKKNMWWGGDAQEGLYDHQEWKAAKKRKREAVGRQAVGRRTEMTRAKVAAGPVMRQRRVSAYFRRQTQEEDVKYEGLAARVAVLEKVVEKMKRRFVRRKKGSLTPRKGLLHSARVPGKRRKEAEQRVDKTSSDEEPQQTSDVPSDSETNDGGSGNGGDGGMEARGDDTTGGNHDEHGGDGSGGYGSAHKETDAKDMEEDHVGSDVVPESEEGEGEDVEMDGDDNPSDGPPPILVPLKEGDGVPLQWVEEGVTDHRGGVVYRAMTSSTYYVADDEVPAGSEVGKDGGVLEVIDGGGRKELADKAQDELSQRKEDLAGIDKLVGDIIKEHGGGGVMVSKRREMQEVSDVHDNFGGEESVAGGSVAEPLSCASEKDEDGETQKLSRVGAERGEDELGADVVYTPEAGTGKQEVGAAVNVETVSEVVTCLSDTSPCPKSEKHQPAEDEAHLASLLLAKEPFSLLQICPAVEDGDFGYFEQVLLANPKAMHLGVGLYDLDNEFFLDLATPQKWVSTKHMEVLVDFLGKRHAAVLKENRAMFVAPWFMEKLVGKAKTFKSSTYKGKVFSDRKLAGFLTNQGQKIGLDVDCVYAPMFWGTNHWVGLRISITEWTVLVYDPDRSLRTTKVMMSLMDPVAKMLPYLLRKVCPAQHLGGHGLEPFRIQFMADGYQNTRGGDCGPVAVKYMELAATGVLEPDVEDITDSLVEIFRKQYAMDVYKEWIVPLYLGGN